MKIQIYSRAFRPSAQLQELMEDKVQSSLWPVQSRVREVQVQLDDLNGPKGGLDSRCAMTVYLTGCDPVFIEDVAEAPFRAVAGASKRAAQAALRRLKRQQDERRKFA